jgi:hypothetical protein
VFPASCFIPHFFKKLLVLLFALCSLRFALCSLLVLTWTLLATLAYPRMLPHTDPCFYTMPFYCFPIALLLPPHCFPIALLLPPHCFPIVLLLPLYCFLAYHLCCSTPHPANHLIPLLNAPMTIRGVLFMGLATPKIPLVSYPYFSFTIPPWSWRACSVQDLLFNHCSVPAPWSGQVVDKFDGEWSR